MKDTKLNYALNVLARWFVGLVFLFSSFVKGVDPMGTSFKVQEYMTAWSIGGMTFEWALPLAGVLSMALICAEFLVGVLLITNAYRRLSAWLLALMMLFFTVTTFIDALTNKVTDCGCFGDAVKLTNWQTFWKNIILDVPTVWIVLTRNLRRKRRFERDGLIFIGAVAAMLIFGMYNIKHEPVIDFRPWKVGNRMMDLDNTEGPKSYVTYRNMETGETEEFESALLMEKMKDILWAEQWEWESSRVIDPREIAAPGFSMIDLEGEDHAVDMLSDEEGLFIVTVHHLDKLNRKGMFEIRAALRLAEENGVRIVMLTSALAEEVQNWLYENKIEGLDYLFADATAIETMMRGNPGFMFVKSATVVDKGRRAAEVLENGLKAK
ncbi:MAG: DoxX family protein [Bacteroidales bacterium]|nr:DoxX family protein [Bacteroidales bacterium]